VLLPQIILNVLKFRVELLRRYSNRRVRALAYFINITVQSNAAYTEAKEIFNYFDKNMESQLTNDESEFDNDNYLTQRHMFDHLRTHHLSAIPWNENVFLLFSFVYNYKSHI
jgi:hypothetical protein